VSDPLKEGSFVAAVRRKAAPIWEKEYVHPFVQGLGAGTLTPERFRFYLCQDYVFLIEYCRVFALAAAKARDLDMIALFGKFLNDTATVEMQLHRDYCERFGISAGELERTAPAPVTLAYTRHLLATAYGGSIIEIAAAILPCQLGYAEIATRLVKVGKSGAGSMYADWIRMYASPEFVDGAATVAKLLDSLTADLPDRIRAPLEDLFLTSSRYEYLFWEMSWNRATWPI
jgi:thiaminase (transcriptional activator TenA)